MGRRHQVASAHPGSVLDATARHSTVGRLPVRPARPPPSARGPARRPARAEQVEDQQQYCRAGDGGQPRREVEEPVQGVDVEQLRGGPAAGQRPATPIRQVRKSPCDLLPGTSIFASRPAPRPRTIHAMMPITDSSVSKNLMYGVAGPARQVAVGGISSRGLLPFTGPLRLNGADLKRKLRDCAASSYFPRGSCQISGAISS